MKIDIVASGKRKRALAKAAIKSGTGIIKINNRIYTSLGQFHRLTISEPVEIAKSVLGSLNFDIAVRTSGGGIEGQMEAARLAIAKAMFSFTKAEKLKKAFIAYDRNMMIADTRRKEPYKPGDSKARAKRQKSYR